MILTTNNYDDYGYNTSEYGIKISVFVYEF